MKEAHLAVFRRKAYERLLRWKEQGGKTSLLIEGPRRVGKTTLAREFGNSYERVVYVDFDTADPQIRDLFLYQRSDVNEFLQYFFAYAGVRPIERETLVIFDEVQRLPQARAFMKQLVADGRYDYLATGSLISIRENVKDIVIPSEQEKLQLKPMSFDEWLWALGEDALCEAIADSLASGKELPELLHRKAMRRWREYLLIGGMPQAVESYLDTGDFHEADKIKRQILSIYRDDISRYGGSRRGHVEAVFDAIPGQLAKHEKKFTVTSLGANARMREYDDAFFWLCDAGIASMCYNATDPSVGLAMSLDHSKFKCYMADTGLLFSHAFADNDQTADKVYRDVLFDRLQVNEGMLLENAIAQQLLGAGHRLFFFSRYDRDDAAGTMELDFLISQPFEDAGFKQRVSPIEVKSGKRYSMKSLDKFKGRYGKSIGVEYVIHPKPFARTGNRIFLPHYMAHLL